jgi:alkanesulfonate monooxygenase SsuD/methylene tetrahydromethanopterin reductase-like flavin-dependent oxidoreductase (luciferase family)
VQPGVLRHLDAAVLRGGQDRAGAAVRICSQLGFPDAPALLAQAAASLDLLSSGRFELGIGPTDTNTWDAIEAMGGVRRTPAESVRALSEAIDIIRGIWDVSAPGMMRIEGKHYRVSGTMRGPPPAHNISIWVPAARRHIRQLVGRKADGWISGRAWMTDVEGSWRSATASLTKPRRRRGAIHAMYAVFLTTTAASVRLGVAFSRIRRRSGSRCCYRS